MNERLREVIEAMPDPPAPTPEQIERQKIVAYLIGKLPSLPTEAKSKVRELAIEIQQGRHLQTDLEPVQQIHQHTGWWGSLGDW